MRTLTICLLLAMTTACTREVIISRSAPPPIVVPVEPKGISTPGSLWSDHGAASIISDDKAMCIGDVVMVEVVTNTSAEEKAMTGTKRSSDISADVEYLLGYEDDIPRTDTPEGSTKQPPLVKASSESNFDGDANTNRSGKISARISCVVTEVYPNGNMYIQGGESVTINHETSVLSVEGIVRPSDISLNNSVRSSQIANARIEYTGRGVVSDVQRPGVGSRLFNKVWPF